LAGGKRAIYFLMKKLLLFFVLLAFSTASYAQQDKMITYSGNPINWSIYTKTTKGSGFQKAFTYCGISYAVKHGANGLEANFTAFIDASQSWVVSNAQTAALLRHEQGLFDLTELYARKMRQAAQQYMAQQGPNLTYEGLLAECRAIYKALNNELFYQQQMYNAETNNGLKKEAQITWDTKLRQELRQLESFSF
jgi:hypothetical protein